MRGRREGINGGGGGGAKKIRGEGAKERKRKEGGH